MLSQTSILKMLQLTSLIASNNHKRSNSKLRITVIILRLIMLLLKILKLKFKLLLEENKVQMRDFLLFQKLNMPKDKSFMNNITV